MIRYAITDGLVAAGTLERWRAEGVDFVQLRNKDVDAGELSRIARGLLAGLRGSAVKLLVNGRVDVALAVAAAGVHLTAREDELSVAQVRTLMPAAVASVSCHTVAEVTRAASSGADWVLFGPVFEKRVAGEVVVAGVGLERLREACAAARGRVLALGGVTAENAAMCVEAGAAGVAGIRIFG